MRILHVYNQHRGGGGANNSTKTTIEVLRKNGLDVEVYTRSSNEVSSSLPDRIKAGIGIFDGRESVASFLKVVAAFDPHVVHVHEIFPLISPWVLPECSRRNIPVVMTCVDYRTTCPIVTHYRKGAICTRCVGGREYQAILHNCRNSLSESIVVGLYTTMVRRRRLFTDHVARFVSPSEFTRKWLVEKAGLNSEKVITVEPVVDIPETETDPDQGEFVAYAGRLTPEKGIPTLLDAARLSGLPFRLACAHNSLISSPAPSEFVELTHNPAELYRFLRKARLAVAPSLWFEAFGLAAAEAMSHGLPLIVSGMGALANLVENGVDGLYFEPGNAVDLSDKVSQLWNDVSLCRRMGHAARTKAIARWGAEQHYQKLKAIYASVT